MPKKTEDKIFRFINTTSIKNKKKLNNKYMFAHVLYFFGCHKSRTLLLFLIYIT